jgi:hypothetical protein
MKDMELPAMHESKQPESLLSELEVHTLLHQVES